MKPLPDLLLTFSRGEDENRVGHDGQVKVKTQMKAPAFIAKRHASGSFSGAKGRSERSSAADHDTLRLKLPLRCPVYMSVMTVTT